MRCCTAATRPLDHSFNHEPFLDYPCEIQESYPRTPQLPSYTFSCPHARLPLADPLLRLLTCRWKNSRPQQENLCWRHAGTWPQKRRGGWGLFNYQLTFILNITPWSEWSPSQFNLWSKEHTQYQARTCHIWDVHVQWMNME